MQRSTESALKHKTAKGLFWGGFSNGFQVLISVAFGIYMARILNEGDYGLVGMLAIFSGIASVIVNSGFSVALTNKQDACHKDYNAVFWFTFFMGLLLYVILFFSAPLIAGFFKRPELINLSRFLFVSFLLGGMGTVSHTVMFKKLMTKQQALIDIIGLITALTVGVIMAIKGLAYWALAAQTVIQVSMSAILKFIIVPWKPTWEFDFSPLKPMLTFSSKLLATSVFSQVNSNIFSVVFGKFYNADQLGVYNQGQKWMWMGNQFIGGMINYVTQPVLAQVTENRERQVNILRKLIRFGAFLSFPLMSGLAFVGKEFILIALGEKWLPSVPFLQLFCLWGAFGFLSTLYTNLIYTKGKSNLFMYGTIITGFLQLIVIVCMYPFGVFPMVIAYILMFFAGLGIWQFYVYKLTGLRLRDVLKDILSYLFITLGCFFIAWLLTKSILNVYFLFVTKILISGFLYLAVMKISKSVIFQESMDFLLQAVKTFFHSTHL